MHKRLGIAALIGVIVSVAAWPHAAWAQASPSFEKKNYTYSEWTKGRFSEAVTVTGPGKMIFLAGVGSEDEGATPGVIRHKDDFVGQCNYAYDKIKRLLERHGAASRRTMPSAAASSSARSRRRRTRSSTSTS